MNTPRRAGIVAGSVLALAALAGLETGCNPEQKRRAVESAGTAYDFIHEMAMKCAAVTKDRDTEIVQGGNNVVLSRRSPSMEEQTETCSCEGTTPNQTKENPTRCTFTRTVGTLVGKRIELLAQDHGLVNAERFTVKGTGQDGKLQKIHFWVPENGCQVDNVSIPKENCDRVREGVGAAARNVTHLMI